MTLTDKQRRTIQAFKPVAVALFNRDVSAEECLDILLDLGRDSALRVILYPVADRTHVKAMLQMAELQARIRVRLRRRYAQAR